MRPAFDLRGPDASPALVDLLNRAGFRSRTVVTRVHDPVPRTYDEAYFAGTYQNSTAYATGLDQYREAGRVNGEAGGTVAYTIDRLLAVPFVVNAPFAIDNICFNVTTGGAAGSKARMGIYASVNDRAGLPLPGRLLYDGGEHTTTGTGVKLSTLSPTVNVEPGHVYWLAYLAGAAAPTVRSVPVGAAGVLVGNLATMGTASSMLGVYTSYTYAALPVVFPAATLLTGETTTLPALQFRQGKPATWSATSYLLGTWPIETGTVLRRARLVPSADLAKTSGGSRDAYVRVTCGTRSRSSSGSLTFESLGRTYDSRNDDLRAGTPFDLVTDESVVPETVGLYARVIQSGWPALSLADAAIEWTLGYEGGA